MQAASPDNLLSLELLWAPEEGNRWLKKREVLDGLAIDKDQVACLPLDMLKRLLNWLRSSVC